MKKAFTLIEILLYIGILTIIITAIVPFAWTVIMTGQKSAIQQEVFNNARYVSERIKRQIRSARNVNPFSSTSITLNNPDGTTAVISVEDNKVKLVSSTGTYYLNTDDTRVTNLVFTNYSSGNANNVGFELTMTGEITSGSKSFQATTTVKSGAEMRN